MEQQAKAPAEIQKVAQFLRGGSSGLKNRVGALNGKRLDYFKGLSFKTLKFPVFFLSSSTAQANLQSNPCYLPHTEN
jgi:translocation protein SEC62